MYVVGSNKGTENSIANIMIIIFFVVKSPNFYPTFDSYAIFFACTTDWSLPPLTGSTLIRLIEWSSLSTEDFSIGPDLLSATLTSFYGII